jgi:phosphoglycolate phosphatase-like HAD superfamily hydrolase
MFSVGSSSSAAEFSPGFKSRPQVSHVVFDFDGTLSWLRHGWPEIMLKLFREYYPGKPDQSEVEIHDLLLEDILSLNGKASIHQMYRCAERVRECGKPGPDPDALLLEYGRRLDLAVQQRGERILSGQAAPDEFLVHGAREMLDELQKRGCTMIILSGTVEHRVKEEAALLDLARYFGNHIYGGTSDLAQSSKQAVIERFLREEKLTGDRLLSFGDGPVEIQVTKSVGGLAIAMATDEEVNGSGRKHPQKRAQLLAAGADVLIPDFREPRALLERVLGN